MSRAVSAALVEGLRHGVTTVVDFHRSAACSTCRSPRSWAGGRVGVRVATCYGAAESTRQLPSNFTILLTRNSKRPDYMMVLFSTAAA